MSKPPLARVGSLWVTKSLLEQSALFSLSVRFKFSFAFEILDKILKKDLTLKNYLSQDYNKYYYYFALMPPLTCQVHCIFLLSNYGNTENP